MDTETLCQGHLYLHNLWLVLRFPVVNIYRIVSIALVENSFNCGGPGGHVKEVQKFGIPSFSENLDGDGEWEFATG